MERDWRDDEENYVGRVSCIDFSVGFKLTLGLFIYGLLLFCG